MPNRPPLIVARQRLWKPNFSDLPRINWSHPLARKLTHCYLFADPARKVYNLANLNDGGGSLATQVTKGSTPAEPGVTIDGTAAHGITITNGMVISGVSWTAEYYVKFTSLPGASLFRAILAQSGES